MRFLCHLSNLVLGCQPAAFDSKRSSIHVDCPLVVVRGFLEYDLSLWIIEGGQDDAVAILDLCSPLFASLWSTQIEARLRIEVCRIDVLLFVDDLDWIVHLELLEKKRHLLWPIFVFVLLRSLL